MEDIRLTDDYLLRVTDPGEVSGTGFLLTDLGRLYNHVFSKNPDDIARLARHHATCPGGVRYFFAYQQERLVAFNYFMFADGGGIRYALSGGSMSDPESRGSFLPLFRYAVDRVLSQVDWIIGFCNRNSYRIFCHPVYGWREVKDFFQGKLLSTKGGPLPTFNYEELRDFSPDEKGGMNLLMDRSVPYLSWRLSNIPGFRAIRNNISGAVVVLKPYGSDMDLVTLLHGRSHGHYCEELKAVMQYLAATEPGFTGLNCYLSFPGAEKLLRHDFDVEVNPFERHLCIKGAGNPTEIPELDVEMLDADLF